MDVVSHYLLIHPQNFNIVTSINTNVSPTYTEYKNVVFEQALAFSVMKNSVENEQILIITNHVSTGGNAIASIYLSICFH